MQRTFYAKTGVGPVPALVAIKKLNARSPGRSHWGCFAKSWASAATAPGGLEPSSNSPLSF